LIITALFGIITQLFRSREQGVSFGMSAQLNQLILSNIRNLGALDLSFGPQFNVFVGANGSGKTSLLEAIYLLGVGRSFRARSMRQVISFGSEQCLIRAKVGADDRNEQSGIWLAVERTLGGDSQYKIGGQPEKSASELTRVLPVQLIDVNSHLLLEGGPNNRRQFIDWGVFHVEHNFLQDWRLMRRALEQRNVALKQRQVPAETWDETFIKYATAVDLARNEYIKHFSKIFLQMLVDMLGFATAELHYKRGWPQDQDLRTALQESRFADQAHGYTHRGPQRADLEIVLGGKPAKDVLSRGQIKIFVGIMLLARAKLLQDTRSSVFLIDDLHSELDKNSCGLFIEAIKAMGCQVFITGIDGASLLERLHDCAIRMFHVEHGMIREQAI
jgi:DNA replication and repair protein RecF